MVGLARFLWMAGMCLNFVGPDALIGPLGGSFHRKSFAAPAASSFLHGQKGTKEPPKGGHNRQERLCCPCLHAARPLDPRFTGVTPWARQNISGAQNLSGCLNFHRATGPWVCKNYCYCGSTIAPGLAEQTLPVRFPP